MFRQILMPDMAWSASHRLMSVLGRWLAGSRVVRRMVARCFVAEQILLVRQT
jgi:hypothetical protein